MFRIHYLKKENGTALGYNAQRGDIAVYMSLLILPIILSSAIVFSLILSRQLKASEDVVESERSFYAANTGLERMQYELIKGTAQFSEAEIRIEARGVEGIAYVSPGGTTEYAEYVVRGKYVPGVGTTPGTICAKSEGSFRNEMRRVQVGASDCLP